jgi:ATP-dependent DNA helicase RecG
MDVRGRLITVRRVTPSDDPDVVLLRLPGAPIEDGRQRRSSEDSRPAGSAVRLSDSGAAGRPIAVQVGEEQIVAVLDAGGCLRLPPLPPGRRVLRPLPVTDGADLIDVDHRSGEAAALDVSVLDELPPGRTPIHTRSAVGPLNEAEVWADVRSEVAAGRQAYVVCPLIEESDKLEVASAEETLSRLSAGELTGLRLGLLHGRLSVAEKAATMDAFRAGKIDVLVATTVIEVGVDVPNATIMVILDADRFGIAQLHQLRGRVGRGKHASRCWLVTGLQQLETDTLDDFETGEARGAQGPNPRIEALVASTDGFELAEVDLELRGEGTLMSTSQKGRSDLRLASLRRDRELVELARAAAEEIVDADPELNAHLMLREDLDLLFSDRQEQFLTKS